MDIKFCSYCAGALVESSEHGTPHQQCTLCEQQFYRNPLPCVGALLFNTRGELLLALRKFPPAANTWDAPGGFMDLEETPEQALTREIEEELAIHIDTWDYVGSYFDRYPFGHANYHTLNLMFSSIITDVTPKASDDISGVQWFLPDAIPYNTISFPNLAYFLRAFMAKKFTSIAT
ncbi:MAG: NUDIX domain-containing protein [Patescibacteria group bacterium]